MTIEQQKETIDNLEALGVSVQNAMSGLRFEMREIFDLVYVRLCDIDPFHEDVLSVETQLHSLEDAETKLKESVTEYKSFIQDLLIKVNDEILRKRDK